MNVNWWIVATGGCFSLAMFGWLAMTGSAFAMAVLIALAVFYWASTLFFMWLSADALEHWKYALDEWAKANDLLGRYFNARSN